MRVVRQGFQRRHERRQQVLIRLAAVSLNAALEFVKVKQAQRGERAAEVIHLRGA